MKRDCRKCGSYIPVRILINGVQKNLQQRKFCLKCSPFGSHNTNSIDPSAPVRPRTYAQYPAEMRRKHVQALQLRAQALRDKLIDLFGGCCKLCGYSRCHNALSFHHRIPSTKKFSLGKSNVRALAWDIVLVEANKCDLLCHNCHTEVHEQLHKVKTRQPTTVVAALDYAEPLVIDISL